MNNSQKYLIITTRPYLSPLLLLETLIKNDIHTIIGKYLRCKAFFRTTTLIDLVKCRVSRAKSVLISDLSCGPLTHFKRIQIRC